MGTRALDILPPAYSIDELVAVTLAYGRKQPEFREDEVASFRVFAQLLRVQLSLTYSSRDNTNKALTTPRLTLKLNGQGRFYEYDEMLELLGPQRMKHAYVEGEFTIESEPARVRFSVTNLSLCTIPLKSTYARETTIDGYSDDTLRKAEWFSQADTSHVHGFLSNVRTIAFNHGSRLAHRAMAVSGTDHELIVENDLETFYVEATRPSTPAHNAELDSVLEQLGYSLFGQQFVIQGMWKTCPRIGYDLMNSEFEKQLTSQLP